MSKPNHDHDHDRDSDHANDNGNHANDNGEHERPGSKIAPAPAGGALTLAALQTALANVNTAAVLGRTGLPMLLFKSRENSGTWAFGQKRTIPEEGSRWAVNPTTFRYGYICFGNGNKVLDERLVPVSQPKPLATDLPGLGSPWTEEWAVNLKCLSGADAGVTVDFKATTDGAIKAIVLMVDEVRDRLDGGQHGGKIVPIVLLEKGSYPHVKHGPTPFPVLNTIDWMSLDGPAPAPAPADPAPPVDQPRRRRVA